MQGIAEFGYRSLSHTLCSINSEYEYIHLKLQLTKKERQSSLLKQCQACTASTCLVSSFTEFLNPIEKSKTVLIYHSSFRLGKQQLLLWIKKLSNTQTTQCTGLGVVISIQHSLASFISRGRNYLFIFISVWFFLLLKISCQLLFSKL